MKPRRYSNGQRKQDARRAAAVQILTMRDRLDNYSAEELARVTGLAPAEASAMYSQAVLLRGMRHG